jgi:5-methyltetrahydrofolate--homocysteine methyltransferase
MEILGRISDVLFRGDDKLAAQLTQQAIEEGVPPKRILDDGLIAGMAIVGERFKVHDIFLPDVLLAARAMYAGMEKLRPLLGGAGISPIGTVVIGSVQGDLHDIGKNLVGIMLKGAGFNVIDLGHDVAPEDFVTTASKQNASVIGMSALLTTTMPTMKKVVELIDARQLNGKIKTIIGGAPVSAEFASDIGADAYGFDAGNAVERVKKLIGTEGT